MAHKNKVNFSPYKAKNVTGKSHKKPDKIFPLEEANDRIYDIFRNHGFADYPHDKRRKLAQFYVLLMNNQLEQNFTRLVTLKDVAIRHFIDCLIVSQYTKLQFPLMDVGSGPGFPGIPLKIDYPNEHMILAEGVGKRADFLKSVGEELEFTQYEVIARNIKPSLDFASECSIPLVRGVITRAVEDVSNTLRNCKHVLEVGGRIYLMKGPGVDPEIELAKKMENEFKLVDDIAYDLPNTPHNRRLVIYEKL